MHAGIYQTGGHVSVKSDSAFWRSDGRCKQSLFKKKRQNLATNCNAITDFWEINELFYWNYITCLTRNASKLVAEFQTEITRTLTVVSHYVLLEGDDVLLHPSICTPSLRDVTHASYMCLRSEMLAIWPRFACSSLRLLSSRTLMRSSWKCMVSFSSRTKLRRFNFFL